MHLDVAGTKALETIRDDRAAAAIVQLELLRYARPRRTGLFDTQYPHLLRMGVMGALGQRKKDPGRPEAGSTSAN